MIDRLLAMFGISIWYRDHRGLYASRYSALDFHSGRPIHEGMLIAYPGAKRVFLRIAKETGNE